VLQEGVLCAAVQFGLPEMVWGVEEPEVCNSSPPSLDGVRGGTLHPRTYKTLQVLGPDKHQSGHVKSWVQGYIANKKLPHPRTLQ